MDELPENSPGKRSTASPVLSAPLNLQPRYNIAPTPLIDVMRLDGDGRRELVPMRRGLVPYFHKGTLKEFKYPTFNARVETVTSTHFRLLRVDWRQERPPEDALREWPVSKSVKNSRFDDDDPALLDPLADLPLN